MTNIWKHRFKASMVWPIISVSFPQPVIMGKTWLWDTPTQLHGNSNNHYLFKTLGFFNLGLCEYLHWEHEEHVFQVLVICCAVRKRLQSSLANTADPKLRHRSSRHSLLGGTTPAPLARTNFHQENTSVIQFALPHPEADHPKEKTSLILAYKEGENLRGPSSTH